MELTRERLRAQVRVIPRTGCWKYIGACDAFGYGRVFLAGKERKAQRVCYEAFIGPIPKGGRLRHHLPVGECIGSKCCNPAHVEVKLSFSSATIAQRMCKKGHLINAENSVIEQRGDNLLVRCRLCRREAWRNEKRLSR